jgi:hypothetical protein
MEESIIRWPTDLLSREPFYGFVVLLGLVGMLVEVFEAILGTVCLPFESRSISHGQEST